MTVRNPFIDPIEAPDLSTKIVAKDGTDNAGYLTIHNVLSTPVTPTGGSDSAPIADWLGAIGNARAFGAEGNGVTDDTEAMQAWLNTGGIKFLPPGTYMTNELTLIAGTRLYGIPGRSILKARTGTIAGLLTATVGASDIIVDGLTLDCNSLATMGYYSDSSSAAHRHKVLNCHILNATQDGIRFRASTDCVASGNTIENVGQHAITFTTAAIRFVASDNIINNPGGAGVIFSAATDGTISGNVITDAGVNGDGVTGYISSNENVTISGNTIITSANHAIHVGGSRLAISGNTIKNSAVDGIFLWGTDTGTSGGTSVPSTDCTIVGNSIKGSVRAAVEIQDCDGLTVVGNAISGSTDHQVLLVLSTDVLLAANTIRDGAAAGIVLRGTINSNISNNKITDHVQNGMRMDQSGAVQCTGNTISDNDVDGCVNAFQEFNTANNNIFSNNRSRNHTGGTLALVGANSIWNTMEVVARSAIAVPHTGTTAETTLATISLPGKAPLGSRGLLEVEVMSSFTNSANNKTMRVKLNGTAVNSSTFTTASRWRLFMTVGNRNSASSQIISTIPPGNSGTTGMATAAIDTSGLVDVTLTAELANSGENITLEHYCIKLIR